MVQEISDAEVHSACARLRFAEALRRRWKEARAESAVQETANLALLEGARIAASEVRELASSSPNDLDPKRAYAAGIWRAAWEVQQSLPPLNGRGPATPIPPLPAVLAKINRNVCSHLVSHGHLAPDAVALPQDPTAIRQLTQVVRSSRPGLEKLALTWQYIAGTPLFEVGSVPTAFLFGKWMLAGEGVEPTSVSVLSTWAAANRGDFADLLALTRSGTELGEDGGANPWGVVARESVLAGCAAGEDVARAIQAGSFPN